MRRWFLLPNQRRDEEGLTHFPFLLHYSIQAWRRKAGKSSTESMEVDATLIIEETRGSL